MNTKNITKASVIADIKSSVSSLYDGLRSGKITPENAVHTIYNEAFIAKLKALERIEAGTIDKLKMLMKSKKIPIATWNKHMRGLPAVSIPLDDDEKKLIDQHKEAIESDNINSLILKKKSIEKGVPWIKKGLLVDEAMGKPGAFIQSDTCEFIIDAFDGLIRFNCKSKRISIFNGSHFERINKIEFKRIVAELCRKGTSPFGFSASFFDGIIKLTLSNDRIGNEDEIDTNIIPFSNGLFNIKTRKLETIDRYNALHYSNGVKYKEGSDCVEFKKWINKILFGDEPTISFIRAFINCIIIGRADVQSYLHLVGFAGTGKGTFIRLCENIVGSENVFSTTSDRLEGNNFELAGVVGKKLVCVPDADGYDKNVRVLRSLTGFDALTIERKYEQQGDGEQYYYGGMMILASNNYISTNDATTSLERRRCTIRFDRSPDSDDINYYRKLGGLDAALKSELSEIINWALELSDDEVTDAIRDKSPNILKWNAEAAASNNPVKAWLLSECENVDTNIYTPIGTKSSGLDRLYPNYINYCNEHGLKHLCCWKFITNVMDMCNREKWEIMKGKRGKNGNSVFFGIRLTNKDQD